MSGLNVFVAPAIDRRISDDLYELRGVSYSTKATVPQATEVRAGERIFDYEIQNLRKPGIRNIFARHAPDVYINLPFPAPISGIYRPSAAFHDLGEEKYKSLPETLDDVKHQHSAYGFSVLSGDTPRMQGNEVYGAFFDELKRNREKVTGWLQVNGAGHIAERFWERLYVEEKRLESITCPIFPYDGRDLG
jgi:hypothetical protein